ncbi:YagK/YfjJ domain-containing protein [Variovorax boronicumulans]|uniref:YagK/YfjJ domain-containing protein n=1 Tax=Variovorax boronicumulans TaxID=436515 RepID=UPI0015876729|nr:inovirus-type Gp2 protein [Variovorax boronicumulans]
MYPKRKTTPEIPHTHVSSKEMYNQLIIDSKIHRTTHEGWDITHVGHPISAYIAAIDEMVGMVARVDDPAFAFVTQVNGDVQVIEGEFARFFHKLPGYLSARSEHFIYSDNVMLFFECIDELGLGLGHPGDDPGRFFLETGKHAGQHFNEFLELIRRKSRSASFRKRVSRRKQNSHRNFESLKKYIDALFDVYSKLLVIRIDVGYRMKDAKSMSLTEVQGHLQRFLNNRRSNELFKHMVGYIWKLEEGEHRGLHYHLCLLFDGNQVEKDEYYADQFCKYWVDDIADGRGTGFNCNRDKFNRYKNCGIGMVRHDDHDKRAILMDAIGYLTKIEQYLMSMILLKTRTLGRGEMPTVAAVRRGRPRNPVAALASRQGTSPAG